MTLANWRGKGYSCRMEKRKALLVVGVLALCGIAATRPNVPKYVFILWLVGFVLALVGAVGVLLKKQP